MAAYTDVVLLRRLLGQARPYWPHVGALFFLSLLASPLSLLTPLPLKIAVDSVIGSHQLPGVVAPFVPDAIARSPSGLLALVNRLLPGPGGIGSEAVEGRQSESGATRSFATGLTDRAAQRNNEIAPAER